MGDAKNGIQSPPWALPLPMNVGAKRKQQTRLWRRLAFATLVSLAVIQATSVVSILSKFVGQLRSFSGIATTVSNPIKLAASDPADVWEDNVWPIRQPTPWDISTDFPYPRKLEFDVEEGTWLRLDVHPKNGDIVFDMLGDLYCLPASSYLSTESSVTKARPILLGVPHDSDPHFSPNGELLVFKSDAELGVENIWITEWKGCDSMDLRPTSSITDDSALSDALNYQKVDEEILANGVKETPQRKHRRLLREGRSSAQRVTNETYRFVSDARFHPSGTKLIATKWYTSQRSLGAGEGWEYTLPSDGEQIPIGNGRRVVGRQLAAGWDAEDYGDQQIGPEQFIWGSEDSLIYSQNVKDVDGTFQYSKDVRSGIYAIFSRNLTTNGTTTLVSSTPGGATRPELSRDGKTLAFVRRVRDKEALVLKDLQSGTIHNIWYGLTYDLGVISAPMGTYPSFAFTPNDDAIIIWAAGKIWRVPLRVNSLGEKVGSGEPHIIPFKAHIEKRLAETRSSETDLIRLEAAQEQRLHAFIDLTVDDEGKMVAFQGAGVSYYLDFSPAHSKGLSTAKKVPVIKPDHAYSSPSFVPGNNDFIIHSRWSDKDLSTLELASLSQDKAYEFSGLPLGRYLHPTLCACKGNKRQIAFIKTGGDYLSGNIIATANPGLYLGDVILPDSETAVETTIEINNLRFIPSQIYVGDVTTMKFLDGNKKLLVHQSSRAFVIDLSSGPDDLGNYVHTAIAEGLMSAELAVPTHQNYVAFVDFFNVFVVSAENAKGKELWSKPGMSTEGIARVSLDGGHNVQWSGDSTRLFWLLGPYLHSLDVSQLAKCSSHIQSDDVRFGVDCIKDLLDIIDVKVSYPTDIARLSQEAFAIAESQGTRSQNSNVYAVTNATVLTMEKGNPSSDLLNDAVLVVRGGIIESVGHSGEVVIPQGASVLNAGGGFVVPGFIDVHAHWSGFGNPTPARSWELETFLSYGVTTLHNPSSDNVFGFVERGRVENGGMVGPRIFHTGDVIYGAGAEQIHNDVADMADAYSALIRIKVEGGPASFSYKNYNQPSRASRQRLLLAARNLSMLCVPEGGMNQDWDITYIVDGMTTVEHALPIPVLFEDVLTLYALSGTGATPTHIVNYGGVMGEQYVWANEDVPNEEKLRQFTRHDILESLAETTHRPKDSFAVFNTSASVAKMVKKGLRAHIGAHGEAPLGVIYHEEMFFTAAGGLDNFEVLRAATSDAAITLGIDSSIGSITEGKLADFLVYPPGVNLLTDDIRATRNLKYVVRGGRVWDADTMVEEWPVKGRKAVMPIINAD